MSQRTKNIDLHSPHALISSALCTLICADAALEVRDQAHSAQHLTAARALVERALAAVGTRAEPAADIR